jgi:hypothetical protein
MSGIPPSYNLLIKSIVILLVLILQSRVLRLPIGRRAGTDSG